MPFQPGQSGNPSGRPRGFAGVAKKILAETQDGAELVAWAIEVWRDPEREHADRWEALKWLADRALGKPLSTVELQAFVAPAEAPTYALDQLTTEEKRALLGALAKARALPAGEV